VKFIKLILIAPSLLGVLLPGRTTLCKPFMIAICMRESSCSQMVEMNSRKIEPCGSNQSKCCLIKTQRDPIATLFLKKLEKDIKYDAGFYIFGGQDAKGKYLNDLWLAEPYYE